MNGPIRSTLLTKAIKYCAKSVGKSWYVVEAGIILCPLPALTIIDLSHGCATSPLPGAHDTSDTCPMFCFHLFPHLRACQSFLSSPQRKERLLHRSTYIFARNSQGQYYVQKRTMLKDYCPGYYEVVAGGVVGVRREGGRERGGGADQGRAGSGDGSGSRRRQKQNVMRGADFVSRTQGGHINSLLSTHCPSFPPFPFPPPSSSPFSSSRTQAGETYAENADREAEEELGIPPSAEKEHLFTFLYQDERIRVFGDAWEVVWDGALTLQKVRREGGGSPRGGGIGARTSTNVPDVPSFAFR